MLSVADAGAATSHRRFKSIKKPSAIDPLHSSLVRMRVKALFARVAVKRSSYYRNEWQTTRKASLFRITIAKILLE